jgi:hypothetical protein
VTTPADELKAAANKLRPSSPAVAKHTVALRLHPAVAAALADWLELEADVIAARQAQPEGAEWAVDIGGDHALAVARAINTGGQP